MENNALASFRAVRAARQRDPHRPTWHTVCPEEGDAMPFDPNGAIFWKGRYHLFYIFQRHQESEPKTVHCWGHLSSIDLVHWRQHPTALDVAPEDPDRSIFSGNAFLDAHGVPTILYHGVGIGNSIAQATDDLLEHWVKSPHNPIVPMPQPGDPGHGVWESWDPHGWFEDGRYHAIFGGRKAALFQGPELHRMAYTGPFLLGDTLSDDEDDLSCPDFFAIGDRHALVAISHQKGIRWWTGTWDGAAFHAQKCDRITWPAGSYFAPESLLAPDGRRILWGWVLDFRPYDPERGWSGVMSQPTVVTLGEDGGLRFAPTAEIERLRVRPLDTARGDSLELEVTVEMGTARTVTVGVRRSDDGSETTDIVYDADAGTLTIDLSRSGDPAIHHRGWVITPPKDPAVRDARHTEQRAPFALAPGEALHLRIFVDRSIVEVYANGRRYLVQRVFPTRPDSLGVAVHADGAASVAWKAWEMAASNPF